MRAPCTSNAKASPRFRSRCRDGTPTRPSVSQRTQPAPTVIKRVVEEEDVYGEEEEDEGIDWLAILLGAVALFSVLGLIPLWLFVLIQYNPALLR